MSGSALKALKRKHELDEDTSSSPKEQKKPKNAKRVSSKKQLLNDDEEEAPKTAKTTTSTCKPLTLIQPTLKQSKLSFLKAPKESDDWLIEDFLYDPQWKQLLKDEFEKKYFLEINQKIKDGYKKDINRPPKELVFNALNSTKLDQVGVDLKNKFCKLLS